MLLLIMCIVKAVVNCCVSLRLWLIMCIVNAVVNC